MLMDTSHNNLTMKHDNIVPLDVLSLDNQLFESITKELAEQLEQNLNNQPHESDVILARGRGAFSHPGNKRFRKIMSARLEAYSKATTKKSKSRVVSEIIFQVRMYGDFVKQDPKTGAFDIVSDRMAREKVGQGLRDALHNEYKSSTRAKKRKRVAAQQVQDTFMYNVISQNAEVTEIIAAVTEHANSDDEDIGDIFLQANMMILDQLKATNAADAYIAEKERASAKADKSTDSSGDELEDDSLLE